MTTGSPGRIDGRSETMSEFYSVRRLPPYVFEQVNRLKASARAAGADIIDLGMGNPDLPTPPHIVEKLAETARRRRHPRLFRLARHQRPAQGAGRLLRPPLRREARPEHARSIATLGSKEGFANMAQAITAPGDVVLCPNPSYPIHAFGFLMAGGVIRSLPADAGRRTISARSSAPCMHSIPKPIAVVVCYPSNPTAAGRRPRFLPRPRQLRAPQRAHRPLRPRLCRGLFRRRAAALDPAGAGRDRRRGRVHLDVEDLLDGRLAHRLRGRQRAADRGARPGEVLSRLRRLHADPGRGGGGAQRPAGLHRRDARDLQAPPRRAGRQLRPRRLGDSRRRRPRCSPGRRSRRSSARSARSSSPSC